MSRRQESRKGINPGEGVPNQPRRPLTEEKLALREMPWTLDKRAAERRRIAQRALELREQGLTVKMAALRLGISRPHFVTDCITEYRKHLKKEQSDT